MRGVRFSTLAKLCAALECQRDDLIVYDFANTDLLEADEQT